MEPTTMYITRLSMGRPLATKRIAASFCENA